MALRALYLLAGQAGTARDLTIASALAATTGGNWPSLGRFILLFRSLDLP